MTFGSIGASKSAVTRHETSGSAINSGALPTASCAMVRRASDTLATSPTLTAVTKHSICSQELCEIRRMNSVSPILIGSSATVASSLNFRRVVWTRPLGLLKDGPSLDYEAADNDRECKWITLEPLLQPNLLLIPLALCYSGGANPPVLINSA